MAIVLGDIPSGYNLSKINGNFQTIEDYINSTLLARADTGVAGEAKMERDLDMDGNNILNALVGDIPLSEIAEQTQNVSMALRDGGYGYVSVGSFQSGATVRYWNDIVQWLAPAGNGDYYRWTGSLPKVVLPGSSPLSESGWVNIGDASARQYAKQYADANFQQMQVKKATGSFLLGGSATSFSSALYNDADGFWYTPLTGTITVPAGSSPTSAWVALGKMNGLPLGDVRNFGAVGNGITQDTNAVKLAVAYANVVKGKVSFPGGYTFLCDKMQFTGISNISLEGPGIIKMIGGRTGAFYYADGAQMTFINSSNISFVGLEFDGNRAGSPLYTGFNHGVQFVTGTGDFRSNSGGDTKQNRNIVFSRCTFRNQGGFNAGIDKFGDGIYLFGCDGVAVHNCSFIDIGRWGLAASDVFNVRISNNFFDCSKDGTVALGFVDIENESTDPVNGSYSYNVVIADNNIHGYGQILVGAGTNSENVAGAKHYLHNVVVSNNTLVVEGGAHSTPTYPVNLVYMGLAPFCAVSPSGHVVENRNIVFTNNTLINKLTNTSIGMGINAQSIGLSNLVKDIIFTSNVIVGFSKGLQAAGQIVSNGYSLRNLIVDSNTIDCLSISNSIGIRVSSTQLVGYKVSNNIILNTQTRAISVEDGRDIGAIDSYGEVSLNRMVASAGVNMFSYIYRTALIGNQTSGPATAIDSTATNMDKDYGNTWNNLLRTIPAVVVANAATVQFLVDVGSQTRFGYTVAAAAPFAMDNAIVSGMMVNPGFANVIVSNLTGSPINKASAVWNVVVEKR